MIAYCLLAAHLGLRAYGATALLIAGNVAC